MAVKTLKDIQVYNDNAKIIIKTLIDLSQGWKEANQNMASELWQNRGVGGGSWEKRRKQIELEMINVLINNEELLKYFQNLLYSQLQLPYER